MGIEYGGYLFTDPVPLLGASLPESSGLFAIQLFDSHAPQRFRPIYFGESVNFSDPRFPLQHEDCERWVKEARYSGLLFISCFKAPLWNGWCRKRAQAQLIARYRPACNALPEEQLQIAFA